MTEIKITKKFGRGIYATQNIRKGTVVERSPVIVLPPRDRVALTESALLLYIFDWSRKVKKNCDIAVVLGLGSIFNHSNKPNIEYRPDFKNRTMVFRTLRDVKTGEQLFSDYNYIVGFDDDVLALKRY